MTMLPFRRSVAICELPDKIIIDPHCRTRVGLTISLPIVDVIHSKHPVAIGSAVIALLQQSFDGAPDVNLRDRTVLAKINEPVLKAAGFKTWAALHKKSKSISCYEKLETSQIEVIPTEKVKTWSEPIFEKVRFSSYDPDELGHAVLLALADSG